MTWAVKMAMTKVGFDPTNFGFHSFRAGFIANAIMANQRKSNTLDGTLSKVAIVTGWRPYSSVELGYIKNTTKANLCTTDLVGVTNTPFKTMPTL